MVAVSASSSYRFEGKRNSLANVFVSQSLKDALAGAAFEHLADQRMSSSSEAETALAIFQDMKRGFSLSQIADRGMGSSAYKATEIAVLIGTVVSLVIPP